MKKTVVLLLAIVMALLAFVSCNDDETTTEASSALDNVSQETSEDVIVVNKIDAIPDYSKMNIALMANDYVFVDFNEYYGTDITPTLPDDVCYMTNGSLGIYKRDNGTGEVYYDTLTVYYTNYEQTRTVDVTVDKLNIPVDFCNLLDEPEKASVISGVEVLLGEMVYDEEVYYAEFMFKGTGFRVVCSGLSQEEIVSVIASLLD